MIDYRFTGHMDDGVYVDIRFRTDAINITDTNFNVLQIQEGQEFGSTDKQGDKYLKYFSGTIKETNSTYFTMYDLAVENGLNLRAYDSEGNETNVILEDSVSTSA